MKIIDKTPFLDEKGELALISRIQGMLQFGFNWPNELQAQKAIITFFDRNLEKGFTLIRNQSLGQSGIMVPMILVGPAGLFVINVSYLRGRYEARGDSWNVESGNHFRPAPINLIQRTTRMARALAVFIERQGVKLPVSVEPVLIAGDPGLHIDSVRPSIRVMMIDGIKSFVSSLTGGAPALRGDAVIEIVERITNPRPPKEKTIPPPPPVPEPRASWEEEFIPAEPQPQNISRARAIFNAAEEERPFDPREFDFALVDEDSQARTMPPLQREAVDSKLEAGRAAGRILGMTPLQVGILAVMSSCLVCILVAAFGFIIPSLP